MIGLQSILICGTTGNSSEKAAPLDLTTAIADVAQEAMPAVVHIEVIQRVEVPVPVFPFEGDPFFRYFFGVPQGPRSYKKELRGIGTGMIIDKEGYIVTNNHVISGATKIIVKMATGEEFPAKIVGTDPKTDLAIIKIKPPATIPYLTFGNSDKLRVGEWVVAIGNPRGLEQTVTAGIISAKHRTGILDPTSYQDYIQTDAAINPGNSGGPLLNLRGEVIGINTAIISESGGFEGIGFAIPSNIAKAITEDLIKTGKVNRGWLGLSLQDITPALGKKLNLPMYKGALVSSVFKNSPAEKAGIMSGDVIISWDSWPIESAHDFRNRVATAKPGKKVEIELWRQGKKLVVQAEVSVYKPTSLKVAVEKSEVRKKLGMEVKEISIMEAKRKRLDKREGVLVTKVDPQGPAGRAGIEPGDIIYQMKNQAIRGLSDYLRLLAQIQSGEEVLLLLRDGRTGDLGYLAVVAE